jgi:hypothetical protein
MNFQGGRCLGMMILLMVVAAILLFVVVVLNFDCSFAGFDPVVPHPLSRRSGCFGATVMMMMMMMMILEVVVVVVAFVVVLFSNVDDSLAVLIHHLLIVVDTSPLSQQTLGQNEEHQLSRSAHRHGA